jgi:uncharacterized protein (TIGR03437 family)
MYGRSAGPPIKRTGAAVDGGQNCTVCHRSFAVDSGPGRVTIAAAPYTPGVKQNITVTVDDPAGKRWGFQLTARPFSDQTKQAGTFTANADIRVKCDLPNEPDAPCNGTLEFASHTSASTRPGTTGPTTFTIEWTPPTQNAGDIIFYAAGNAADNSGTNVGDRIYTTNLLITPASVNSNPTIVSQMGALNAATYQATIAQNSWIAIFGTYLAATTRTWRPADFTDNKLPTQLSGVSVNVNGKPAYVYYTSPAQLNVLSPLDNAEGPVQVEVIKSGARSNAVTAQMQKLAPAFFLFDPEGRKYIAATHANGSLLGKTTLYPGSSTPAKPGEVIVLYATGFGLTDPPIAEGEIVSGPKALRLPITVRFGEAPGEVSFAGLSASGLYQINVKVPDGVPDGDVPVAAEIEGLKTPGNVFVTVQR